MLFGRDRNRTCNICGAKLSPRARYCDNCGAKTDYDAGVFPSEDARQPRKSYAPGRSMSRVGVIIVVIAVFITAISVIALAFFRISRQDQPMPEGPSQTVEVTPGGSGNVFNGGGTQTLPGFDNENYMKMLQQLFERMLSQTMDDPSVSLVYDEAAGKLILTIVDDEFDPENSEVKENIEAIRDFMDTVTMASGPMHEVPFVIIITDENGKELMRIEDGRIQ